MQDKELTLDEAIDITETRFYVESPRNPKERYAVEQVIKAARLYQSLSAEVKGNE